MSTAQRAGLLGMCSHAFSQW
jgi:hypothetical protein